MTRADSTHAPPPAVDAAAEITAHALRLNDRFAVEVVEAFSTCPFARTARLEGRTRRAVLLQSELDAAPVLETIDRFERGDVEVEVVQLILPRVRASAREFDEFVSRVRTLRAGDARAEVFALASFHPAFAHDTATADSLVPFFRRTPDPTIQLVRRTVLEALSRATGPRSASAEDVERFLRGTGPAPVPLSAWIARENFARAQREGIDAIAGIYASIAADRERSYAGLLTVCDTAT